MEFTGQEEVVLNVVAALHELSKKVVKDGTDRSKKGKLMKSVRPQAVIASPQPRWTRGNAKKAQNKMEMALEANRRNPKGIVIGRPQIVQIGAEYDSSSEEQQEFEVLSRRKEKAKSPTLEDSLSSDSDPNHWGQNNEVKDDSGEFDDGETPARSQQSSNYEGT